VATTVEIGGAAARAVHLESCATLAQVPPLGVHTEDLVGPAAREEACAVAAYVRISIEDARFAAIVFVVVWTVCAEACTAKGICIAAARE
jgi:hypothetical protein